MPVAAPSPTGGETKSRPLPPLPPCAWGCFDGLLLLLLARAGVSEVVSGNGTDGRLWRGLCGADYRREEGKMQVPTSLLLSCKWRLLSWGKISSQGEQAVRLGRKQGCLSVLAPESQRGWRGKGRNQGCGGGGRGCPGCRRPCPLVATGSPVYTPGHTPERELRPPPHVARQLPR